MVNTVLERTLARKILILLLLLPLAACGMFTTPQTRALRKSPDYRAGYQDGCNSAYGPGANKRDNSLVRDEELYRTSKAYRSGWGRGNGACRSTGSGGAAGAMPNAGPVPDRNPGGGSIP